MLSNSDSQLCFSLHHCKHKHLWFCAQQWTHNEHSLHWKQRRTIRADTDWCVRNGIRYFMVAVATVRCFSAMRTICLSSRRMLWRDGCNRSCRSVVPSCNQRFHILMTVTWLRPIRWTIPWRIIRKLYMQWFCYGRNIKRAWMLLVFFYEHIESVHTKNCTREQFTFSKLQYFFRLYIDCKKRPRRPRCAQALKS